jgi:hypothetical protein
MDTRKIIDYAMDDNAKEMRESLYASIYDRVAAAFEQKRIEVAGTMLGMPLSTEEVVHEEKDDDKDDDKEEKEEKEDDEDCEKVAKKEVKKHEKSMHGEQY